MKKQEANEMLLLLKRELASALKKKYETMDTRLFNGKCISAHYTVEEVKAFINEDGLPTTCGLIDLCKSFDIKLIDLTEIYLAKAIVIEKMHVLKTIGDNIREYKDISKVSAKEIGKILGSSQSTIYKIINYHTHEINISTIYKVNDALNKVDSTYPKIYVASLEEIFMNADYILTELHDKVRTEMLSVFNKHEGEIYKLLGEYVYELFELDTCPIQNDTAKDKNDKDDKNRILVEMLIKLFSTIKKKEDCSLEKSKTPVMSNNEDIRYELTEYEMGFRDGYFQAMKNHNLIMKRMK